MRTSKKSVRVLWLVLLINTLGSGFLLGMGKNKLEPQIMTWLQNGKLDEIAKQKDRALPILQAVINTRTDWDNLTEEKREKILIQQRATRALGWIPTKKSLAVLDGILNSPRYLVEKDGRLQVTEEGVSLHEGAILALKQMAKDAARRPEVLAKLQKYLINRKFRGVRIGSIMVLGDIGDRSSIPFLQSLFSDPGEPSYIRREAAVALAQLGDASVLDFLIDLIDRHWQNPSDVTHNYSDWGYHGLRYLAAKNPVARERLKTDFQKCARLGPKNLMSIEHFLEGLFEAKVVDNAFLESVILSVTHPASARILVRNLGRYGNEDVMKLLEKIKGDEQFKQTLTRLGDYNLLAAEASASINEIQARMKK